MHSQWLRSYGQASLEVLIQPNTQLEVFYAPPFHQFTTGTLGLIPQQRKGLGCLIGIFGGLLAVVLLMIILAALFGERTDPECGGRNRRLHLSDLGRSSSPAGCDGSVRPPSYGVETATPRRE